MKIVDVQSQLLWCSAGRTAIWARWPINSVN